MRRKRKLRNRAYYHVSSHFHRAILCLRLIDNHAKQQLAALIRAAARKFRFKIKNLCIMDTHFHVLICPADGESLSDIMKYIKQRFTQWFNRVFDLKGSCWADRFFSRIVEGIEDMVRVFVYIEDNPVKAGLVAEAINYPFYQVWDASLQE